jgi:hypothetical protein
LFEEVVSCGIKLAFSMVDEKFIEKKEGDGLWTMEYT